MIEQRMTLLTDFGNQLPHAKVYYREDWDCIFFDLLGKQFGMMSKEASEESMITLKGPPEKNEEWREMYQDVIAGYYANKKHWNSIYLKTTELSDDALKQMVQVSYDLVWKNLPAKVRNEYKEKS